MNDFCEHRAFFEEAMSFYKSAQIVQESDYRVHYEEIDLFGPVIYLYRHAAELLFKSLIIRSLCDRNISDRQGVKEFLEMHAGANLPGSMVFPGPPVSRGKRSSRSECAHPPSKASQL